jgi:hypothetical protein
MAQTRGEIYIWQDPYAYSRLCSDLTLIPVGGGQFIIRDRTVSKKQFIIEVAPIDTVRIPT